jgi:ribonuclease VapC
MVLPSDCRRHPVDETLAEEALAAWRRFGKGRHSAGLNYGDVFSYALARQLDAPLLFVGGDFAQTDVPAA